MGFWAIICFVAAAIAIETGDMFMLAVFGGLGVLLTYLWAPKDKRAKKRALEEQKQREEAERQRKEQVRQRALTRFNASPLAVQIIRDMRNRNWLDLDYKRDGCCIYFDKIATPCQKYTYRDYGLKDLDEADCEELAEYLGLAYGREYCVKKMTKFVGGVSSSYSGHIGADGSVSLCRDGWSEEKTIGYKVYSKASVPPAESQGKSW